MMDICLIIQKQHHENIILFATLAITVGCAQSKDKKVVPKVVKEAFQNIQIRR
jgi:hypothetical protein